MARLPMDRLFRAGAAAGGRDPSRSGARPPDQLAAAIAALSARRRCGRGAFCDGLKSPVTPLIDTFLLPLVYFLLLEDLDERASRRLAWLVGAFLAANALVGLAEFATGWRLITVDLPANVTDDPRHTRHGVRLARSAEKDGRPTALLGHPLTNACITGVFIATLCAEGRRLGFRPASGFPCWFWRRWRCSRSAAARPWS